MYRNLMDGREPIDLGDAALWLAMEAALSRSVRKMYAVCWTSTTPAQRREIVSRCIDRLEQVCDHLDNVRTTLVKLWSVRAGKALDARHDYWLQWQAKAKEVDKGNAALALDAWTALVGVFEDTAFLPPVGTVGAFLLNEERRIAQKPLLDVDLPVAHTPADVKNWLMTAEELGKGEGRYSRLACGRRLTLTVQKSQEAEVLPTCPRSRS